MAVEMRATYTGQLGCEIVHGPSQSLIKTDAPVDNHGRGLSFSPTDLVGAALASCALTTMALAARAHGFELGDTRAVVEKHMNPQPDRFIQKLVLQIHFAQALDAKQKTLLEHTAHTCPVAKSLGRTALEITFTYT